MREQEAITILKKNYDIEELFSIESKVIQNTETVTDIQAIRNAVAHGSFDILLDGKGEEYIIDFQSALTGYSFNN